MGIQRKPSVRTAVDPAEAFIEAAPDGVGGRAEARHAGRVYKTRKVPVSFTAEPDLLTTFDQKAVELGMSRAALLSLAMSRIVRGDL